MTVRLDEIRLGGIDAAGYRPKKFVTDSEFSRHSTLAKIGTTPAEPEKLAKGQERGLPFKTVQGCLISEGALTKETA